MDGTTPWSQPQTARDNSMPIMTVAVACTGFFLITLDATVVNVALPTIGAQLHGDVSALQWVVDSYTLVFAALMLSSGSVSDRVGASRAFRLGLALFALASAGCGLAASLGLLIAARALQGTAAAAMLPASLALVRQTVPGAAARARAVAWWTAGGGVAVSAGPVIGGVLTSLLGWRSIFLINLPVGVAGILGLRRLPRSSIRAVPLDPLGQTFIVVALGGLTFAVIEAGRTGPDRLSIGISAALFTVGTLGFLVAERRTAHPSIPYEQFRRPTVLACTLAGFTLNFTYFGIVFVLSVFFQHERDTTPLAVGLLFLPMTALILIMNLLVGHIVNRYGTRLPIALGQSLQALGFLAVLLIGPDASLDIYAVAMVPIGIGVGLTSPPMMTALLEAVDPDRSGLAAGFLNAARQSGSALGVALFGALIANHYQIKIGLTSALAISMAMLLLSGLVSRLLIASSPTSPTRSGRAALGATEVQEGA